MSVHPTYHLFNVGYLKYFRHEIQFMSDDVVHSPGYLPLPPGLRKPVTGPGRERARLRNSYPSSKNSGIPRRGYF